MRFNQVRIPLYIIASLLLGVKTYIVYRFLFNISLENSMQEFILFINPFISAFLLLAISVWFRKTSQQLKFIRYSVLIGSLIIYFNLVFYRSFTDFLTVPQLFQTRNLVDLSTSISSLLKVYDVLFFVDVIIVWYLCKYRLLIKLKPFIM